MIPGPDSVIACPHCDSLGRVRTLISGNTFGARLRSDGLLDAPRMERQASIFRCNACDGLFSIDRAKRVGEVDRLDEDAGRPEWRAAERLEGPDAARCLAGLAPDALSDVVDEKSLRILAMWKVNDLVDPPRQREWKLFVMLAVLTGPVAIAMWIDTALAAVSAHQATNPAMTGVVVGGVTVLMLCVAWLQPPAGMLWVDLPVLGLSESLRAPSLDNLEALVPLLRAGDEQEGVMLADVYRQLGRFDEGAAVAASIDSPDLIWAAIQIRVLCEQGNAEPQWLDSPSEG